MTMNLVQRHGKIIKILSRIVVVIVSVVICLPLSWRIVEKMRTSDVSHDAEAGNKILVLVKGCDGFSVQRLIYCDGSRCSPRNADGCGDSEGVLVTNITDAEVAEANRDLHAYVSDDGGTWEYLKVIARGKDYVDVSLMNPTTSDFWDTSWYRMQNGAVHPQRICFYGPGWLVFLLPIIAIGVAILFLCYWLIERYVRKQYGQRLASAG